MKSTTDAATVTSWKNSSEIFKNINRSFYLDNLKIFLIFLVIMHHVGQGYGPSGEWWFYMTSQPEK